MRQTMLTDDYLIRMINLALAALGRIMGFKTASMYMEAQQEIDLALEELFGLRANLLRQMDDSALLDMLTFYERLDTHRLMILTLLLKEQGDLYHAFGNQVEGRECHLRALNFSVDVALEGSPDGLPDVDSMIEELLKLESIQPLPPDTLYLLFHYDQQLENPARAVGWLDELLKLPDWREQLGEETAEFYRGVLSVPDGSLQAAGLQRKEIQRRLQEMTEPE